MNSIQRLLPMGMTLESTQRQLKNGTYVLRASAVKTTYSIYTNPSDGTIKRISYRYDLQHHSQDGKIAKATPGMSVEEAIPHLLEQYNKYLIKHTVGCHNVADGAKIINVVFTNFSRTDMVLPPQELLDQVFGDTSLIVCNNVKITRSKVASILSQFIEHQKYFIHFLIIPSKLTHETWANLCETILGAYNCTASVTTAVTTREGLSYHM